MLVLRRGGHPKALLSSRVEDRPKACRGVRTTGFAGEKLQDTGKEKAFAYRDGAGIEVTMTGRETVAGTPVVQLLLLFTGAAEGIAIAIALAVLS